MTVRDDFGDGVRPMRRSDLERILAWRNHPKVRRYMFNGDEITMDDHARWFEDALQDPDIHVLIFELDGKALGYVNFNASAGDGSAEWGFYTAPEAPLGSGQLLGRAALGYAFTALNLTKVSGKVLGYNERSLRLHEALGFHREGVLRNKHFDGTSHHDVICFNLPASAWQAT